MSLTVGDLVAYATLDQSDFSSGARDVGTTMTKMQRETTQATAGMESSVTRSLAQIEQAIKDGLDPTAAIADLDRLDAAMSASLAEMEAEADRFAVELAEAVDAGFTEAAQDAATGGDKIVKELREALAEAEDAARRTGDDAGRELVDALRKELNDAERVARKAGEDAGEEFGEGTGRSGRSKLASVGDSMLGAFKGLAWLELGKQIGELIMSGLESALDAETAKAKLSAQIGATGEDARKYGKIAGDVYAEGFGEGLEDVTNATRAVVQNLGGIGPAASENVGQITKEALTAAQVLDEDVSEATRAVGTLVKTDLVDSWTEGFDLIVAATAKGGNAADDLLDTLTEYSTQFRAVGIDGPKAFGLLSQAWQAGARDLDTVADAVKEFAIRSKDGTDLSRKSFQLLNLDADKMFQIFAKGGPEADKAMTEVIKRINGLEDPVKKNTALTGLFGTKAEDLQLALTKIDPTTATQVLGDFAGATKKAGDTLADTAASKIETFKRGLQQNVTEFLSNEVIPVVKDLWKTFEETGVFEVAGDVIKDFGGILGDVFTDIKEWLSENKGTVKGWGEDLKSVFETVRDVLAELKEFWDEWGDEIVDIVGGFIDSVGDLFSGGWDLIIGLFKTFKGLFTGDWDKMWEGIKQALGGVWKILNGIFQGALDKMWEALTKLWNNAVADTKAAWNKLVTAVETGGAEAVKWVKSLPGKIVDALGDMTKLLYNAGRDVIFGFINGIKSMAVGVFTAVSETVKNAVTGAEKTLDSHSPSRVFENIGINTIKGFVQGILRTGQEAVKTATDWMGDVVAGVGKEAGTGGGDGGSGGGGGQPSTKFAEIGKLSVQGLMKGLTSENANIKDTITKLVADIKKAFSDKPDIMDNLLEFVKTGNKNLEDLALQRESIVKRLAAAKEYAKQVAGDAAEFASLGNLNVLGEDGNGDIAGSLQTKAQQMKQFAKDIQELSRRGLNKKTLQQIIDSGVEEGLTYAEMLVGSDGSEIKAINKAQAAVDKASKALGKSGADALYDTGKKAGEGYLKGLQASLKDLDKEMSKIVKALVAAIKKELKIKSPSQVMLEIGQQTIAGLIVGVGSSSDALVQTMTDVVNAGIAAATKAAGSVGTAASSIGAGRSGATSGGVYTGDALTGPLVAPGGGQPAVAVHLEGSTIREEADIAKIGQETGFAVFSRG